MFIATERKFVLVHYKTNWIFVFRWQCWRNPDEEIRDNLPGQPTVHTSFSIITNIDAIEALVVITSPAIRLWLKHRKFPGVYNKDVEIWQFSERKRYFLYKSVQFKFSVYFLVYHIKLCIVYYLRHLWNSFKLIC